MRLIDLFEATLYHGSPHEFTKFSTEHMGTGEGTQAYGWGIYFSEEPDVAKSYVPRDFDAEDIMMAQYKKAESREDYTEMEMWENAMMHETPEDIVARYAGPDYDDETRRVAVKVAGELEKIYQTFKGNLYTVYISDQILKRTINWDNPIGAQRAVMNRLKKTDLLQQSGSTVHLAGGDATKTVARTTGSEFYHWLAWKLDPHGTHTMGNMQAASKYLNSIGIPGVNYLDQESRNMGVGTNNYVLFDGKYAKVIKRL